MQQLPKNDMDNYKINSTLKPTKKYKQKNSFRRKSLKEYIISYKKSCFYIPIYKS